ncbi:MAG: gliding motility-associated C-terminal domain-containing protein [Saprospiraceae bacterium]|nr:gliding motility-associated C-terminal domain-containing protein [Saprospiraceae bacterium]
MARRVFTKIVFALGLLCFIAPRVVNAQQVTFAISPSTLSPTPAVGDTVSLQVSVTNFTNIVSFQYAIEWDPLLFSYISLDNVNIVDPANFGSNAFGGNTVIVGWNSNGGAGRTIANGQNIFRLRLKVKATSTNYWAKFSSTNTSIEVVQFPATVVTPAFGNLGNPPGSTTTPVTVQATAAQTVPTQSKVCLDVSANDFTNIASAQWVTKWDAAVLRFDSISVMNSSIGFTSANFNSTQASGRLALNWAAASGTTKTVANGSVLYRVCYTAIGANGTSSTVSFDSAQIYQAVAGSSTRVSMNPVNGTVNVNSQSTGLVFTASNHIVNQNEEVCVQVKTASFNNIATMTYAIFFDSSKMTLIKGYLVHPSLNGTDTLFPGGSSASFNNNPSGTIRFVWVTPTGNGVTLPDSSVIMQLCFRYTGGAGTSSLIRFGAYGQKQAIKDGDLNTVPTTYRNGSVSVSGGTAAVTVVGTIKNVTCPSGADGGITLTPSGGTGTYTYLWSNNATTKDISNVVAGKYKVTITSGTSTKIDSFTITEPTAFAATGQTTSVNCFGQSTGAINLTASGGTSPYTYLWSNNATTKDITNLAAGSYTVTITDSKGCKHTPTAISVTQPSAPLSISATKTNVTCKSADNGTITITPTGGTVNYTYSWVGNNGYVNNTQNLTGLKPDIYSLTVTDSKGCATSRKDTIIEPDSLLIGIATIRNTRCGSQDGSITISGVTGGNGTNTYSWTGTNYTANTQNISNLAAGQYTLTVRDSKSCTSTKSFTVTDSTSTIVINTPTISHVKCNGGTDGTLSASATGGNGSLSYIWSGPSGFSSTSPNITGLRAGTYNLSVTDGSGSGCFKSASYEIIQPAALATNPSVTNIKCKDGATGAIVLNATGGTGTLSFAWTGVSSTSQNVSNLRAGNYTVTITDGNNCARSQSFTLTEPSDSLKVLSANVVKINCAGGSTGAVSLTVGGGTQPYSFAWSGPSGFSSTSQNINTLSAGTYRVTLSDANQCSFTTAYNVESNPAVNIVGNVSDATRSPNGAILLTVTGGTSPYNYVWSGQGVNPTSKDQTGLCPGTYSVTVTDALGCRDSKTFVVNGECSTPMAFSVAKTPAGCPGQNVGKLELTVTGGAAPYKYYWISGRDTIGRDRTLLGLTAGVYSVIVEDLIGQRKLETYTVEGSQTSVRISNITIAAETCAGADGSIKLDITGGAPGSSGYSYAWSDIGNNGPKDRLNMRAGTFSVTISDANGCRKDTTNLVIPREPCPLVAITSSKSVKCFGDNNGSITVNIQNGEPGYTIRWTQNDSVRINNQPSRTGTYEITGLRAGIYTITITDSKGQTKVEPQIVTSPTQIRIERTVTPVTNGCNGSIVLAVTGGQTPYNYTWNTGATSRDLFGLCCDTTKKYSVTVRDAANCEASTGNDTVSCIIAALSVDATVSNPICKADSMSGRIDLRTVGGSAPFTYAWTNDRGIPVGTNSPTLTNVPPGKYFVTVTDSRTPNAQRWSSSFELNITSTLKLANLVVTAASDDITADGKAEITIQGGAADFNVVWCNGSSSVATNTSRTPSVSNLTAGTCSVTVTDRQGCREKLDFTVPSKSCATIETLAQIKCFGDENGSARVLKISPDMALPIQSYTWSTAETGPIAFKLKAGENTVTIRDANGKTCVARAIMNQPTKLVGEISPDFKARTLEAIVSGGTTPYSIKWIPTLDTARKITATKSGTYYMFVTDRNGCNATDDEEIVDSECLTGSSVISPNDDSRNEAFKIFKCDYKSVRLEVYNRWGQLVYSKDNYASEQWQGNDQDGTAGKQLPDGVYLYILRTVDAAGQQVLGKGTVTIVRQ